MNNVFVFSSSYLAHTFVYSIDYVLNVSIGKVYLLKENHSKNEFRDFSTEIILEENVVACMKNCDIVIVLNNGCIPPKSIVNIQGLSIKMNKQLYIVDVPNQNFSDIRKIDLSIYKVTPTILNIAIGRSSQQYCTEILLNRIFNYANVNFIQEYSTNTSHILQQFSNLKILSFEIERNFHINNSKCNVIVKSLSFEDIESMIKNLEEIKLYHPDYIVLNSDLATEYYEELKKHLYNGLSCHFCLVYSKYFRKEYAKNSFSSIFCDMYDDSYYYIDDKSIERKLKLDLFSKLSYPDKVSII